MRTEAWPWHGTQWRKLQASLAAGRVPHGLVLAGGEGCGAPDFARALAASLLCGQPAEAGQACGHCRACHLFSAGTHPEFLYVEREERKDGKGLSEVIKVEQVRALRVFMGLSRQLGHRKLALIEPADRLNPAAANALLKTLEEPPGEGVLLLRTGRAGRLPATVRSRCQRIDLERLDRAQAAAWLRRQLDCDAAQAGLLLAIARGQPLRALELGQAPETLALRERLLEDMECLAGEAGRALALAAAWAGAPGGAGAVFGWLASLLADVARCQAGAPPEALGNPDLGTRLQALGTRMRPADVLGLEQTAQGMLRTLADGTTLREQNLLEDFALRWSRPGRPLVA